MKAKASNALPAAVVDSSPIMSMFEGRSSARAFVEGLRKARKLYMSAGTLLELSVVFIGKKSAAGTQPLDDLLAEFEVEIVPFDRPMVVHGRRGCASYGKGHNPAGLDVPLYFEGLDFFQTDVKDAMAMLGYAFDARHSPRLPPT